MKGLGSIILEACSRDTIRLIQSCISINHTTLFVDQSVTINQSIGAIVVSIDIAYERSFRNSTRPNTALAPPSTHSLSGPRNKNPIHILAPVVRLPLHSPRKRHQPSKIIHRKPTLSTMRNSIYPWRDMQGAKCTV
jgi:hypothetical protein